MGFGGIVEDVLSSRRPPPIPTLGLWPQSLKGHERVGEGWMNKVEQPASSRINSPSPQFIPLSSLWALDLNFTKYCWWPDLMSSFFKQRLGLTWPTKIKNCSLVLSYSELANAITQKPENCKRSQRPSMQHLHVHLQGTHICNNK